MAERACAEARLLLFDHRRGELDLSCNDWLDRHLGSCSSCREHGLRLHALLDAAREESLPQPKAQLDRDTLFERIMEATRAPETMDHAPGPAARAGEDSPKDASRARGKRRPRLGRRAAFGAVATAALSAAAVLAILLSSTNPDTRDPRDLAASVDESSSGPWLARELALGALRVVASPGARWSFSQDEEQIMTLEEGALLVEYSAKDNGRLRLLAPTFEVEVLGTVFLASTFEDGEVAVLRGRVDVHREDGTLRLGEGSRVVGNGPPIDMTTELRDELAKLAGMIETEQDSAKQPRSEPPPEERADIEEVASPPEPSRPRPGAAGSASGRPAATSPARSHRQTTSSSNRHLAVEPGAGHTLADSASDTDRDLAREPRTGLALAVSDRWGAAEASMAARDWQGAALEFERILSELTPGDEAAATLHLDLARIYGDHLGEPARAVEHLRRFVSKWPDDVTAPAAHRRLCGLSRSAGLAEPGCEE